MFEHLRDERQDFVNIAQTGGQKDSRFLPFR